jgi:serine/threonine-protein kinase
MVEHDTGTAAWAMLNGLLDQALDLPSSERSGWLDRLPPELHALRPRLERMLSRTSDADRGARLDTIPKFADGADSGVVPAPETIGPYRILRKVGAGGMGRVWLARRTDVMVNRLVALKLPRGEWHGAGLAQRLAHEREILAALNHPDIARLYDAGVTSSGQPYLALEYIDGRPIDEYVKAANLPLRDRLRLAVRVARAVAHAHARLVVHRDLKPSNILVTGDGQVKLLDFGIATLLEGGRGSVECSEPHLFTPDYASPEQIAGEVLGTATDVYSLGVVLFEVATGVRRFNGSRWLECAGEPCRCRPSDVVDDPAMRRLLRGDLDAIVLKALAPEPDRRYATMDALADDIGRYLANRPVEARGGDVWYRLAKRTLRHKVAIGAAAAVLVALVGGMAVAAWQAQLARREKARAVEARDFLTTLIQDANPFGVSGRPLSAADWLLQAKARTDGQLADRPVLRVQLLSVIGSSLANLQDSNAADAVLREAIQLGTARLGADHPETLRARVRMTVVDRFRGRTRQQREELEQLLPRLRAAGQPLAEDLSIALRGQAQLDVEEGRYAAAGRAADEAVDVATRMLGESHPEYVVSLLVRAYVFHFSQDAATALDAAGHAFQAVQQFYRGAPQHPRVIEGRYLYGRALAGAGHGERGAQMLERAVADAEQTLGPSSRKVGVILLPLVQAQIDTGRVAEAIGSGRRAVDIIAREAEPDSLRLATALQAYGAALLAARRVDAAIPELERAAAILRRGLPAGHDVSRLLHADLGLALARAGKLREARTLLREQQPSAPAAEASLAGSRVLHAASVASRLAGNAAEALHAGQLALKKTPAGQSADVSRMRALTAVGFAWLELGKPAKALAPFEDALRISRRVQSHTGPDRADVLLGMGRAQMLLRRPEAARPLFVEADRFWRAFDAGSSEARQLASWLARAS